jgi:hypothetical protein
VTAQRGKNDYRRSHCDDATDTSTRRDIHGVYV